MHSRLRLNGLRVLGVRGATAGMGVAVHRSVRAPSSRYKVHEVRMEMDDTAREP
jgi:hypothetical protein